MSLKVLAPGHFHLKVIQIVTELNLPADIKTKVTMSPINGRMAVMLYLEWQDRTRPMLVAQSPFYDVQLHYIRSRLNIAVIKDLFNYSSSNDFVEVDLPETRTIVEYINGLKLREGLSVQLVQFTCLNCGGVEVGLVAAQGDYACVIHQVHLPFYEGELGGFNYSPDAIALEFDKRQKEMLASAVA